MKKLLWILQLLLIILGTLPIALAPLPVSLRIGDCLGTLLYLVWGKRRSIAIRNLSEAVARNAIEISSTPESVIRQNFRNLGRSFAEVIKIYYGLGGRILDSVQVAGEEHLRKALEKGKGVLFVTAHCGNWEILALTSSWKNVKLNVVARQVNNPYLNQLLERTRQKYGNSVIYKKGALRHIIVALKKNEAVGILMDQSVVPDEGIKADFLGKQDYIMKTPALIARKTGAAAIPVFIRRSTGGHVIELGEEIPLDPSGDTDEAVANDTKNYAHAVEAFIRKNPTEWLWMHRRWKRSGL